VFTEVLFVEANRETFGIPMSVVEQITATPSISVDDGQEVVRRSELDVIGELPDDGAVDVAEADGGTVDDAEMSAGEADDVKTDEEIGTEAAEDSYPLIRLESALDLQEGVDADEKSGRDDRRRAGTEGQVVWVRDEDERLAIRCDRVVTSREVVVRPYGDLLRDVPGVSGATTLGDGEAVNVLDVGSL
jgi:chemotaxis protein histidine kinase CheA